MSKQLIIIRHAHRDTGEGRGHDNGLSEKGKEQAQQIKELFKLLHGDEQVSLCSSPYLRCKETLEPLAESIGVELTIDPMLAEMQSGEGNGKFNTRVKTYADQWLSAGEDLRVVCSHGDVLPALLYYLSGVQLWLKKGAWVTLKESHGQVSLRYLFQRTGFVEKLLK